MEHPFVVCHMLTSLDGKIDGTFFGVPETVPAIKAYGELRSFYGCQATLYGTTTMLGGICRGKGGAATHCDVHSAPSGLGKPDRQGHGQFHCCSGPTGSAGLFRIVHRKKGPPM